MIDLSQTFWLALLQGLTEFLPISSSGHLVLVPNVLGWPDQGLLFDVAVHIGTLLAVVIYLRRDLGLMIRGLIGFIRHGDKNESAHLGLLVALASLPVLVTGLWIDSEISSKLRQPLVIGISTIVFGIALWLADFYGSKCRKIENFGWRDALIIGIAQALALIPGTSRAGITITAGLMIGAERQASARFSFLMSIPVILAAGAQQGFELSMIQAEVYWPAFLFGVTVSAITAWLVIKLFMRWIERSGMLPFVLYRMILGACILVWLH